MERMARRGGEVQVEGSVRASGSQLQVDWLAIYIQDALSSLGCIVIVGNFAAHHMHARLPKIILLVLEGITRVGFRMGVERGGEEGRGREKGRTWRGPRACNHGVPTSALDACERACWHFCIAEAPLLNTFLPRHSM
jgi:hypothetical protein